MSTIGKLRVGYRDAATLGKCVITRSQPTLGPPETNLVAKVSNCDEYWSTQRPVQVGIWMGESWWVWTKAEVDGTIVSGNLVSVALSGAPDARLTF